MKHETKLALINAAQTGQILIGPWATQEAVTELVGSDLGEYITAPADGTGMQVIGFHINDRGRRTAANLDVSRDQLVDALRAEFTDSELHALIITAERRDNRGANHWERLKAAAIRAADCNDCAGR